MNNFYDSVYSQENLAPSPRGWIQWKGTDICIDLHCGCGYMGHYDGDFFYFYECPVCHTRYAVGQNVKLIPLTEEQSAHVETKHVGFKTCDLDEF